MNVLMSYLLVQVFSGCCYIRIPKAWLVPFHFSFYICYSFSKFYVSADIFFLLLSAVRQSLLEIPCTCQVWLVLYRLRWKSSVGEQQQKQIRWKPQDNNFHGLCPILCNSAAKNSIIFHLIRKYKTISYWYHYKILPTESYIVQTNTNSYLFQTEQYKVFLVFAFCLCVKICYLFWMHILTFLRIRSVLQLRNALYKSTLLIYVEV